MMYNSSCQVLGGALFVILVDVLQANILWAKRPSDDGHSVLVRVPDSIGQSSWGRFAMHGERWTNKDTEYLKENWKKLPDEKLGEYLGRTKAAVKKRRSDLRLLRPTNPISRSGQLIDESGNTYEHLTVLRRADNDKYGKAQWECRCSCGSITVVSGVDLRNEHTTSCGCRGVPDDSGNMHQMYGWYKHRAKKKDFGFSLTVEQFRKMTSLNCFYCGAEPANVCEAQRYGESKFRAPYIYNGLDRLDNDNGYHIDNVVTCCAVCNLAKREMSVSEFAEWIERVYKHFVDL